MPPCDCNNDEDSVGKRCGGRSAKAREGGKNPSCGGAGPKPSTLTQQQIREKFGGDQGEELAPRGSGDSDPAFQREERDAQIESRREKNRRELRDAQEEEATFASRAGGDADPEFQRQERQAELDSRKRKRRREEASRLRNR